MHGRRALWKIDVPRSKCKSRCLFYCALLECQLFFCSLGGETTQAFSLTIMHVVPSKPGENNLMKSNHNSTLLPNVRMQKHVMPHHSGHWCNGSHLWWMFLRYSELSSKYILEWLLRNHSWTPITMINAKSNWTETTWKLKMSENRHPKLLRQQWKEDI